MGADLSPRKKDVEPITIGIFSWSEILSSGVGLVIGAGRGGRGKWFYCGEGANPFFNEGAKVSAADARIMARCATTELRRGLATGEITEDSPFAKALERFAEFARASGGFSIY